MEEDSTEMLVINQRYNKLVNQPDISPEEERELLGDKTNEENCNKVINSHLKIVFGMAIQYAKKGYSFEDLFQEGVVGLRNAVDKFNPDRKSRYSSVALYWVKCRMMEYMKENTYTISVPHAAQKKIERLKKFCRENPNNKDALAELEKEENMIPVRIDNTLYDSDEINEFSFIRDESRSVFDTVCTLEEVQIVKKIISELPENQRLTICYRYGLFDNPAKKLSEISKIFGLTEARISKLQKEAEASIRRQLLLKKCARG